MNDRVSKGFVPSQTSHLSTFQAAEFFCSKYRITGIPAVGTKREFIAKREFIIAREPPTIPLPVACSKIEKKETSSHKRDSSVPIWKIALDGFLVLALLATTFGLSVWMIFRLVFT